MDGEGFFTRWSRRKTELRRDASTATAPTAPVPGEVLPSPQVPCATSTLQGAPAAQVAAQVDDAQQPAAPQPTLQDVEQLNAESDYRSFVAPDVDPEVRNAAFRKMFHSDPHFNVMDGLDVYIDDYSVPNPLPLAIMKTLLQARAMGLIDDELKEQDAVAVAARTAEPALPEVVLVPDRASNDEPLSAAAPATATAEGTVVPFPLPPNPADPA